MTTEAKKCKGPVYYGDQGIVACTVCEPFGCICCDHKDVDHSEAEYECLIVDGECLLKDTNGHPKHVCKPPEADG